MKQVGPVEGASLHKLGKGDDEERLAHRREIEWSIEISRRTLSAYKRPPCLCALCEARNGLLRDSGFDDILSNELRDFLGFLKGRHRHGGVLLEW